ncbi:MAG: sodium:proton antiporter [Verrucomicrobiales bacterium]|jgi:NhaP-type Na+/H+ or K+/H+ antiporter|nr:sodium:proton antiporter [Verrucomicrobiales bacterium]MBP9225944.1 sodium:proton antiporter [Verrucomicrobiales bacterium]
MDDSLPYTMEERLIYFSSVLFIGIAAQWLAWKWKLPSILLLLGFGFVAGQFYDQSEIVNEQTLFAIVSLAVGVIMLEGGLSLRFSELRDAGSSVLRLISFGSLITWGLSSLAAHYVAGFSWPVSILVSSIFVVTGPTVIGPLLQAVKPTKTINSILKWEGIVIDPIGAILAVLVFGVFFGHGNGHGPIGFGGVAMNLGATIAVGLVLGGGGAFILARLLASHRVPDFLQSPMVLSLSLIVFTLSNVMQHESGLLSVTILGIGLANQERAKIRHVIEFKENLRTLLISCLFIVLGARIGLDDLLSVWKVALLFLILLIVVVRPVSVFLCQWGNRSMSLKEKLFLSLMAPRGIVAAAVSSVFALKLAETGGEYAGEASRMVSITYFVIVGTVAFYGLVSAPLARRLGLAVKNPQGVLFVGIESWSVAVARAIQNAGFRVLMLDSNYAATQRARMEEVPSLHANVLSDFASEGIDMSGIGYLVAGTPNDEVNTLACISLSHSLGASNVFQLKPEKLEAPERKSSSGKLTGRIFGSGGSTHREIHNFYQEGVIVKVSALTAEFSYPDLLQHYGESTLCLFTIKSSGELLVVRPDSTPPQVGDQVICLVRDQRERTAKRPSDAILTPM